MTLAIMILRSPGMRAFAAGDDGGFTLIEVMIALVIALLAVDVLTGGLAGSLRIASSTAARDRAISTAESRLAAISAPDLVLGDRTGQEADGSQWRTSVALVSGSPAPGTGRRSRWTGGTGLYSVSVAVSWHQGGSEHSVVLNSARLGPLPGSSE
jgi:general secretion pathway protein I